MLLTYQKESVQPLLAIHQLAIHQPLLAIHLAIHPPSANHSPFISYSARIYSLICLESQPYKVDKQNINLYAF